MRPMVDLLTPVRRMIWATLLPLLIMLMMVFRVSGWILLRRRGEGTGMLRVLRIREM